MTTSSRYQFLPGRTSGQTPKSDSKLIDDGRPVFGPKSQHTYPSSANRIPICKEMMHHSAARLIVDELFSGGWMEGPRGVWVLDDHARWKKCCSGHIKLCLDIFCFLVVAQFSSRRGAARPFLSVCTEPKRSVDSKSMMGCFFYQRKQAFYYVKHFFGALSLRRLDSVDERGTNEDDDDNDLE